LVPHAVAEDFGVSSHPPAPSHTEFMQVVGVHSYPVPVHVVPMQASPNVHGFPSSHAEPVRHCQTPSTLVQRRVTPPQITAWHRLWLAVLHVCTAPPAHSPSASASLQPTHDRPTVSWFTPQLSGQDPAVVRQPPDPASHPATQQPPAPQAVVSAPHVHVLHTSPVPEQ